MGYALVAVMELWASTMGQLLKDATSIELVEVDATNAGQLGVVATGRLVDAVRSTRAIGSTSSIQLGPEFQTTPQPKDRLLVVCDRSQCPRAVGIEKQGVFLLEATEPMDGALIWPPIVAHTSLPVLAQGKPAPPLCLRATIALLDDKATRFVDLSVDAATGSGTATAAWDPQALHASVTSPSGAALGIALGHAHSIAFAGTTPITVDQTTGCLAGTFAPTQPVVRTWKTLAKALDAKNPATRFAAGSATLGGKPVAIELSLDERGQLVLKSGRANGRSDWSQILATGIRREGFPSGGGKRLVLEFPAGTDPLIATLAKRRSLAVKLYELAAASNAQPNAQPKLLGSVTLAYVTE